MIRKGTTGAPLGIDETIDQAFQPVAHLASKVVFYSVSVGGSELPLIVVWLIAGAALSLIHI